MDVPRVARGRLNLQQPSNKLVDAEWILVRLGHDDLSLVDARPDDEFSGADNGLNGRVNPGHIPGAKQLYWENLLESRDRPVFHSVGELARLFAAAGADPSDTVVTYCQVGLRASVNYMIARMLGYHTLFFDGSWRDWGSRDFPFFPRRATQPAGGKR
jgi:thiosulfate/3-mercaptopyruvate sulfurtransferase